MTDDRHDSDFERRLRSALHASAAGVTPDPQTWDRVRSRIERRRIAQLAGAGVVVAVVAAVAVLSAPNLLTAERNIEFASDIATTQPPPTEDEQPATPAPAATPSPADAAGGTADATEPAATQRPEGVQPAPGPAATDPAEDPARRGDEPAAEAPTAAPFTVDIALTAEGSPCGEGVVTAARPADRAHPLSDAVRALLDGPTPAEAATGLTTAFSGAGGDMLRSVNLGDGLATVDFDGELTSVTGGGSASSCQALAMLAQLDATVGQFATVDRATYRLLGSSERFAEWLQMGADEVTERPVG